MKYNTGRQLGLLFTALFSLASIELGVAKKFIVLYPSTKERTVLALNKISGNLIDGQGAFNWFYCSDLQRNSAPPFAQTGCASSIVLLHSNPTFKLALSAIDEDGVFTSLDHATPFDIKVNDSEAILKKFPSIIQPNSQNLMPATIEFEVEVHFVHREVKVDVILGSEKREIVLKLDNQEPTWEWKLRSKDKKRFESHIYFSEPIFQSVGTYCDRRLYDYIPQTVDQNRIGYNDQGLSIGPVQNVTVVQQHAMPCVEDKGGERNLTIDRLLLEHSNTEPESMVAVLSPNRTVLSLNGKFKLNETLKTETPEFIDNEIRLIVKNFSFMDAAGNQLTQSITIAGNATEWWLWSHQTTENVGMLSSHTALAASATAVLSYLVPSSYGGNIGMTTPLNPLTDLLSMGQKFYFIGLIGKGVMPDNYRTVSSHYSPYAFDIKLPWEKQDNSQNFAEQKEKKAEKAEKDTKHEEVESEAEVHRNPVELLEDIESLEIITEEDPFKALFQVLFWVALLYITVSLIRLFLVGVVHLMKKSTPSLLFFPRLEIFATFWAAPAIAAKCPSLLGEHAGGFLLAVVVFLLFPGLFLGLQVAVLHINFFKRDPSRWRVRLVSIKDSSPSQNMNNKLSGCTQDKNQPSEDNLVDIESQSSMNNEPQNDDDESIPQNSSLCHPSSTEKNNEVEIDQECRLEEMPNKQVVKTLSKACLCEDSKVAAEESCITEIALEEAPRSDFTLFDRLVWPFVGGPIDKTKWESVHHNDRFLQRFGPLFEDFRAPDWQHRDPSQDSKETKPRLSSHGSLITLLTLATALADSSKLIVLALVCNADVLDMEVGQIVFGLCICFSFFVFLRLLRPYRSRAKLAIILVIELADCLTFILALVAVTRGKRDPTLKGRCGFFMLCFQGLVYFLMFVEKVSVSCFNVFSSCASALKKYSSSGQQ